MTNILHIITSTRGADSATTMLAAELIDEIRTADSVVTERRLADGVPQLSVAATAQLTAAEEERSADATDVLASADTLIAELEAADVIVIGAPIYNFGPPASLKAWADLVARAGTTFGYSETGPVGLLADRPAYIVAASGGTPIGGDIDFGTTWLQHFLGFIGIRDVTVISANGLAIDADAGLTEARTQISELAA